MIRPLGGVLPKLKAAASSTRPEGGDDGAVADFLWYFETAKVLPRAFLAAVTSADGSSVLSRLVRALFAGSAGGIFIVFAPVYPGCGVEA